MLYFKYTWIVLYIKYRLSNNPIPRPIRFRENQQSTMQRRADHLAYETRNLLLMFAKAILVSNRRVSIIQRPKHGLLLGHSINEAFAALRGAAQLVLFVGFCKGVAFWKVAPCCAPHCACCCAVFNCCFFCCSLYICLCLAADSAFSSCAPHESVQHRFNKQRASHLRAQMTEPPSDNVNCWVKQLESVRSRITGHNLTRSLGTVS